MVATYKDMTWRNSPDLASLVVCLVRFSPQGNDSLEIGRFSKEPGPDGRVGNRAHQHYPTLPQPPLRPVADYQQPVSRGKCRQHTYMFYSGYHEAKTDQEKCGEQEDAASYDDKHDKRHKSHALFPLTRTSLLRSQQRTRSTSRPVLLVQVIARKTNYQQPQVRKHETV
jgi:hypothetical protein